MRLIPIPGLLVSGEEQLSSQGLFTAARVALLRVAFSPAQEDLLVLGGSLPQNAWGDLVSAAPAFDYLSAHPWIRVLDGSGLLRHPAVSGEPDCPDLLCGTGDESSGRAGSLLPGQVLAALEDTPDSFFRAAAWQAYLSLTEPAGDLRLADLRAGYLGQVGPLLAAARWTHTHAAQSDCAQDLDWDGLPECVLSTAEAFTVLDPQGGRLVLAVARTRRGPIQIIGQRSQLVVGLGDPLEWRAGAGLAGDPQDIPGAFSDTPDFLQQYRWETTRDQVIFVHL